MKEIQLTQNKVALVDDEDFERLNQYKWYASFENGNFYAKRNVWKDNEHIVVRMHRVVLNLQYKDGIEVDHKNNNSLDNTKDNLRKVTRSQNNMNQKHNRKNCSSQYKGVSWFKRDNKWETYIRLNNKYYHLGKFVNEIDAAKHYDEKAKELFGEYACLNFKD